MKKSDYRCFLYKQVEGKTVNHIFSGTDAEDLATVVDKALAEGWHTTFADFVDDLEIDDEQKHRAKDICSIAAGDANILVNADQVKDINKLKEAYERVTGNKMDKRVKSIAAVRNVIKKALGDANVNQ